MKTYIGTKTLKAKPMTRAQYVEYRGWELPENENGDDEVYLVEYPVEEDTKPNHPDHKGYISMSPKTVFEKYYKENRKLHFSDAIIALKDGKMVQRSGWNGKGLFVFMQIPAEISLMIVPNMQSLPKSVKDEFDRRYDKTVDDGIEFEGEELFNSIRYTNQLAIVYPNNTIHGWTPSVSDSLAQDWIILD